MKITRTVRATPAHRNRFQVLLSSGEREMLDLVSATEGVDRADIVRRGIRHAHAALFQRAAETAAPKPQA